MDAWIAATLAAALIQTGRFMLQRRLRLTALSTAGATFARFLFAAPLATVFAVAYARTTGEGAPGLSARFWSFALTGGLAQILATLCVVALLAERNFAIGIALKKTEMMQTALVGWLILGEAVSAPGLAAMLAGFAGVVLLSEPPAPPAGQPRRRLGRVAALGLASGAAFGVSAVSVRGATLALTEGDAIMRAATTLAVVTAAQATAMAAWLGLRAGGQVAAVIGAWRVAGLVGLASMAGSLCWFTAFALQNAAYVNAVGQAELVFGLAASALVFREPVAAREYAGIAFVGASVVALALLG